MADFMETYFGPLTKDACVYFFILSVIFFIILCLTIVAQIYVAMTSFKQLKLFMILPGLLTLFNIFIVYFLNRLFYSMCIKSLI